MIKRLLLISTLLCALALLAPAAARAQEERPIEVFGGFSYLFADVGGSGFADDPSGIGFNGGFAFFLNDWLGAGGEVGYNTGDLDVPLIEIFPRPEVSFSQWTALFGPRFRVVDRERFRIGAQAMLGVARGSAEVEFDDDLFRLGPGPFFELTAFEVDAADTVFAALFGVHFDIKLRDRIVWRVVEPDLLITGYGDDTQTHFRLSTGLAYAF